MRRRKFNLQAEAGMESEYVAEQSVLGALLSIGSSDNTKFTVDELINLLEERYFYHLHHRIVFQTIRLLTVKQISIDLITVCDALEHHGYLEDIGGIAYLVDLQKNLPSIANVKAYIEILQQASNRRAYRAMLQTHLSEPSEELENEIDSILSDIERMRSNNINPHSGTRLLDDLIDDWLDLYQQRFEGIQRTSLTTGIENIDAILAPVYIPFGSLVVVGARPKMGKTQYVLKMAEHIGLDLDMAVINFSLEMTHEQLTERMLGMNACVPYDLFYETREDLDKKSSEELAQFYQRWQRVTTSITQVSNQNFYINDETNSSIEYIEAESRCLAKTKRLGAIIVDYLTLMPKGEAERNDLAYAEITRRLKQLAKDLNCVVFLVTQLNRSLEMRQDKRPLPSDSRDTGQIEQDCDLWIGLYRDAFYNVNSEYPLDVIEVLIRLNRHGGTGTALCRMETGTITNYKGKPIRPRSYKDTMASLHKDKKDG
ncbi:replicative DNA helicase [Vibrio owensii]|uniref:replicative DNA helicase n=1 Tax=Vibrio owensii TaxID=696485 RepID=UPI0038CEE998